MESQVHPDPTPEQALEALASAHQASRNARAAALYSRSYAAGVALWSGAMGVAVGFGSALLLPILFGGLALAHRANVRRGAKVREVSNPREAAAVVSAGLAVGAAFLIGRDAVEERGATWMPWAIGATVALLLFAWMELAHRATRLEESAENGLQSEHGA